MATSPTPIIQLAYKLLTSDGPLANVWLSDETIHRIISERYPEIAQAFKYNRAAVKRALIKVTGDFDATNSTGV
jgi:hypothetical protein